MADVDLERLRAELADLTSPVVSDHGAELVDVEVAGKGSYSVKVLVHHPEGVTVRLCEGIAREISDLFDVEDPVPGRYRLEVTSPGLDRPLRTDADFRRAQHRLVKVVLQEGQTERGRLAGFTAEAIELGEDEDDRRALERSRIAKATIEVEF